MAPRIPAGHDRIELYDDGAKGASWRWRKTSANNERIASSGESFSDKTAARDAAERANGVTFPEGQDYVDVPVGGPTPRG